MSIAVGNEKVFEFFGKLFPEIRKVVIDEMQPVERCRFTRCSKLCQTEVKRSKNYIYGLRLSFTRCRPAEICVLFDKDDNGFKFQFCIDQISNKKYKKCVNRRDQELWKTELDNSTDFIQHCAEEFQHLLQLYENTIQSLYFSCSDNFLNNFDFEIQSLKYLKKLDIRCDMNLPQIFSKLQKPLKELFVGGREMFQRISGFEEIIYQVQNKITLWNVGVNYEQLTRLSARHIKLDTRSLTEMDVFNLIRFWQNSTDWKNAIYYNCYGGGFDFGKLLNLLRFAGGFEYDNEFLIKHFKDDQKVCKLRYYWSHFTLNF